MTISLRTRLYLAVAVILLSVAVSATLSRRATLFEVSEDGGRVRAADLAAAAGEVRVTLRDEGDMAAALDAFRRATRRGFLLADERGQVITTSNPGFADALKAAATTDDEGRPSLRLSLAGGAQLMLPNVPVFDMTVNGAPARLFALTNPGVRRQPAVQPWVLAAGATALVALALMYGLARRILRPIGALTDAARRMEEGDLNTRVDVRGGDELGELARAFNSMAARLARNESLRRQMIGDVAHELRSPVTNLRCVLEGVQDGLEQPDAATIATLYDETMFLQRLISDLQDLTLAEAGSLPLHPRLVNLADVVERVGGSLMAVPGGAPIAVELAGPLPVVADPDRLEQIIRNLLANARQHTPGDGVICVRGRQESGHVRLEVTDSGAGIAAEHLPHVFERFYRADPSRSRRTGGAGLGLAIVEKLVAAQGGSVTAQSEGPGQGATFVITLPTP